MTDPSGALAIAREYLAAKGNSFWSYSDDGEVLTWPGGQTIVFREELRAVVDRLTPLGLPPLGPLLLLLAACRDGWSEKRSERAIKDAIFGEPPDDGHLRIPISLRDALDGLDQVARLPAELRRGVAAKAALAETVFEARRPLTPAIGRALALLLTRTFDLDVFQPQRPQRPLAGVVMALSELRGGLARVHADSLRLRLKTGLDQLVGPAPIELPPEAGLRDFVNRLRNDPELGGLGRLARDLMAAVQLPRAVSDPEELPLGGVSDITNRGPLDRLLTSELAQDDLTLTVRLALNEALYLRRETPPKTPPSNRLVLIDAGIRLWGLPRVFAAAAALALAATGDRRASARAYRAARHGIEPVELHTREGLIAHLAALEHAPHPAAALRPFFDQVRQAGRSDAVLVTHEDVLADAEFRRELAAHDEPLYVATVAGEGRFRLALASRRGLRPLREAVLDLERLLAPTPRPAAPLLRSNAGTDLPAILTVEQFPLLLPHAIDPRLACHDAKHGLVTVSSDGRLMHWPWPALGGRQVSTAVPRGKVWIVSVGARGVAQAVVGGEHGHPLWLVRADLAGGGCHVGEISTDAVAPLSIIEHQQTLFAIYARHVETVVCGDATRGWIDLPASVGWCQGRFFRDLFHKQRWFALAFDGLAPRLEPVRFPAGTDGQNVLALFDRMGLDGPWAVSGQGEVFCTVDGKRVDIHPALDPPLQVRVGRDGDNLLFRQHGKNVDMLLSLGRYSIAGKRWVHGDPEWLLAGNLLKKARTPDLRHHARAAGADAEGRLLLITRKGQRVRVEREPQTGRLHWRRSTLGGQGGRVREFQPLESPAGTRIELAVAAWPDGTRIWLDGRGLLHLRSSDPRQAEVTLVLACDKAIAGWTSDGQLWGPVYFTGLGPTPTAAPDDVVRFLDTFTAHIRCFT